MSAEVYAVNGCKNCPLVDIIEFNSVLPLAHCRAPKELLPNNNQSGKLEITEFGFPHTPNWCPLNKSRIIIHKTTEPYEDTTTKIQF